MAEEKKYIIGDFEYTLRVNSGRPGDMFVDSAVYVGATGIGSVATLPKSVELEGSEYSCRYNCESAVKGKQIEKIIAGSGYTLEDMPILKEVVFDGGRSFTIKNCPRISNVEVNSEESIEVVSNSFLE